MNDMKVGDIGILVGKGAPYRSWMDGHIAEILAVNTDYKGYKMPSNCYYIIKVPGYPSGDVDGHWGIAKNRIRPLSDPDQKETEEEEEVSA